MDITFAQFVRALRNAALRVSPAETLDAFRVLARVGIGDKALLRDALALTLAKTLREKRDFDVTFDRFFNQLAFRSPLKKSMLETVETDSVSERLDGALPPRLYHAVMDTVAGNQDPLALLLQRAAQSVGVANISSLREKTTFARKLNAELFLPSLDDLVEDRQIDAFLRYLRQHVRSEINDFVTRQYEIHVDPSSKRALLQAAFHGHLNRLPGAYVEELRTVVKRMAERLINKRKRVRKHHNGSILDLKRTLRKNMAYGGSIFEPRWSRRRKHHATVFVICDVSSSVAQVARFLLLFLYELVEILPNVRAFAFSSTLGEVTESLQSKTSDEAIETALLDWGKGNTDYGRAFVQFRDQCGRDLNSRSTLLILGDGRSNYYEPRADVLRGITRRVKQTFWLNPEVRQTWRDGDSEMHRYAPLCTRVDLCNRLTHLERFADRLLRSVR